MYIYANIQRCFDCEVTRYRLTRICHVLTGITAKASKLLDNGLEEREILFGIAGGGSGKVTLKRQAHFSWDDEQTTNQWWIASAYVHTPKRGQIDW